MPPKSVHVIRPSYWSLQNLAMMAFACFSVSTENTGRAFGIGFGPFCPFFQKEIVPSAQMSTMMGRSKLIALFCLVLIPSKLLLLFVLCLFHYHTIRST